MSMNASPNSFLTAVADTERTPLADSSLAWATDAITRAAIHVMELGPDRNGAACGCVCPACAAPLLAVNAGKDATQIRRRPHFRHPDGVTHRDCSIVAARWAALRLWLEEGVFHLPARCVVARHSGLSGQAHEGYAEVPDTRVGVARMAFVDHASALLTLDDGRELLVLLSGRAAQDPQGRAVVEIQLDDPALAGLDPEELRGRLRLVHQAACWKCHWQDEALQALAAENARARAVDAFDGSDDMQALQDVPPHLRRQTLLHWAVVDLLTQTPQLRVPAVLARGPRASETLLAEQMLVVTRARAESRLGSMVPDVMAHCATADGEDLGDVLIEVVVTHAVDAIKTGKILHANLPALEIDLRRYAGTLDRAGLSTLVVHALEGKRWVHYPGLASRTAALQAMHAPAGTGSFAARRGAPARPVVPISPASLADQVAQFEWTPLGSENLTSQAVAVYRRNMKDGAFRQFAPRIEYDRILSDAVLARAQVRPVAEMLTLWAQTYRCESNLDAITKVLEAARLIFRIR